MTKIRAAHLLTTINNSGQTYYEGTEWEIISEELRKLSRREDRFGEYQLYADTYYTCNGTYIPASDEDGVHTEAYQYTFVVPKRECAVVVKEEEDLLRTERFTYLKEIMTKDTVAEDGDYVKAAKKILDIDITTKPDYDTVWRNIVV